MNRAWYFRGRGWGVPAKRALLVSAAVTVVTGVCLQLGANFAISSFFYLLLILVQSLVGDFFSSVVGSFEAAGCLQYFFVDPHFSFRVAQAVDVVALLSFLATALVVTQLVARVKAGAVFASQQRAQTEGLYRLSQQLLAMQPEPPGTKFLEPFHRVFGNTAVCMFDAETTELHIVGHSRRGLEQRTREAYLSGRDTEDRAAGITVRCLKVRGKSTGAIGFENLYDPGLTSGPLVALAATVLERARAIRDAGEAAAAAQTEVYRSAVLDALAHEFKTPLSTILAAAGGLREVGSLTSAQLDLAELVETEAARLGGLTSRLLRMARIEREEVKPRMEAVDVTSVLAQLVDRYARRSPDRHLCLIPPSGPLEVEADPELFRLAVSQLLENACKYSQPGSAVTAQVEEQSESLAIRVSNNGSCISDRDRHRIFERFYRGMEAHGLAAGSGLGLYVARKIATAHGGDLNLENQVQPDGDVTFRLTIPRSKSETHHGAEGN